MKLQIFSYWWQITILQFAEQQKLNFFSAVLPLQLQKDEKKKITAKDR